MAIGAQSTGRCSALGELGLGGLWEYWGAGRRWDLGCLGPPGWMWAVSPGPQGGRRAGFSRLLILTHAFTLRTLGSSGAMHLGEARMFPLPVLLLREEPEQLAPGPPSRTCTDHGGAGLQKRREGAWHRPPSHQLPSFSPGYSLGVQGSGRAGLWGGSVCLFSCHPPWGSVALLFSNT